MTNSSLVQEFLGLGKPILGVLGFGVLKHHAQQV